MHWLPNLKCLDSLFKEPAAGRGEIVPETQAKKPGKARAAPLLLISISMALLPLRLRKPETLCPLWVWFLRPVFPFILSL